MKLRNKNVLLLFFIFLSFKNWGQVNQYTTLTEKGFLKLVKQFHPIAKQADLITKNGDANLLYAKGSFDPKIYYDSKEKYYDNNNYYNIGNGGFMIPTWYGIDFKMGYENNNGNYLNPENKTAKDGLIYTQVSLPVLQGLVIDERRATLRKAILFAKMSDFEKKSLLNDLLFNAGKTYWNWQLSYSNLQVLQNSVSIAQQRFESVKKMAELGDRPFIDTVEANIQLQERLISFQQAQLDFQTQSFLLSNYLWLDNNVPVEITDKTIPEINSDETEGIKLADNNSLKNPLLNDNPVLKIYEIKIKQFEIDRKLKQDKLKPQLNFNYNPLFNANNINTSDFNNYKWGITMSFPLFLRKERGDLRMSKIKVENAKLENYYKRNELNNKFKIVSTEIKSYQEQYLLYQKNVKSYEQLWKAEKAMFETGESSLFIINNREMSFINSQIKLNDIIAKIKKSNLELSHTRGLLNTEF